MTLAVGRTLPSLYALAGDAHIGAGFFARTLLSAHAGWAVSATCAIATAGTIVTVQYAVFLRGSNSRTAFFAGALALLCMSTRLGISFESIDWLAFAWIVVLLERRAREIYAVPVTALASGLLTGGATFIALLCICTFAGVWLHERRFSRVVRTFGFTAAASTVAAFLQFGWPWNLYGARALYLDTLSVGNERVPLFQLNLNAAIVAFAAILVLAGWFGIQRIRFGSDAIAFFAFALLAMIDARALPFFAIVAIPMLAQSINSVSAAAFSKSTGRWLAGAAVLLVAISWTFPWRAGLPPSPDSPLALARRALADEGHALILCTRSSWCDAATQFGLEPLVDDRSGFTHVGKRELLRRVDNADGDWQGSLLRANVAAIIAPADAPIASLLWRRYWRQAAADDSGRVLFERRHAP